MVFIKNIGGITLWIVLIIPHLEKRFNGYFVNERPFSSPVDPENGGGHEHGGYIEQSDFPRLAVDVGHIHRGMVEAHMPQHPHPAISHRYIEFFPPQPFGHISKGIAQAVPESEGVPALFHHEPE